MQSLFILGRQPALGLAELEALYGAAKVGPVGAAAAGGHAKTPGTPAHEPIAALLDVDPEQVDFDRLGGSIKFAKLLIVIGSHDWRDIERFLIRNAADQAALQPEGKLTIGISTYGLKVTPRQIEATGLSVKKAIKKTGRPVRLVPNKETQLNTAQVLHNKLTGENGWELVLVRDGNRTILAQTVSVQDIESYTVRDRERPKRDSRVGMLPPKLAQILINLSAGPLLLATAIDELDYELPEQTKPSPKPADTKLLPIGEGTGVASGTSNASHQPETAAAKPGEATVLPATRPAALPEADPAAADDGDEKPTILDPFCGTGVVLQEALLTGYGAYGSDIDQRMVDYSLANVDWLRGAFAFGELNVHVERGDATNHTWTKPFSSVACETYLGRPFTSKPSPEVLNQTVSECNLIIKKFLKNIAGQLKPGTRLCLGVPAWQVAPGRFKHLPLIDQIAEMGYNRMSFEHVRNEDLLYYRADQVVARELLVIIKQ